MKIIFGSYSFEQNSSFCYIFILFCIMDLFYGSYSKSGILSYILESCSSSRPGLSSQSSVMMEMFNIYAIQ